MVAKQAELMPRAVPQDRGAEDLQILKLTARKCDVSSN